MLAPFFNTESHKIAVVMGGRGTIEIVRQRREGEQQEREQTREREQQESEEGREQEQEEQEQEQSEPQYERIRTQVTEGDVYAVPPGVPIVHIASSSQNLEVLCFETRAERNQRIFLAGPNNPWRRMEDAVKELTFGRRAREVDEKLSRQKETVIMAGPEEREELPLSNIMNFFGF
ncbi:RmlC-like cupins domain-containing protein [Dioscorea alata]|uniref:RmlC-like cupins domain-containing protein n=1 Tax=Dioscorea alata TaxID=55571 RepID=A0ACB7VM90_DIOAL|nr:RmlC-like cupins domain-containing protein [Dioscorea alata]